MVKWDMNRNKDMVLYVIEVKSILTINKTRSAALPLAKKVQR